MFHEPQTGDSYCSQWEAVEGSRLKYDMIITVFQDSGG